MSRVVGGRYRIIGPLGGGGTSLVHRAAASDGREVAIKELRPQFAADPAVRRRFLREGELARTLVHPGIVGVIDGGEEAGIPFLVLELMRGETLRARLQREGRLTMEWAWPIFVYLARALDHAHAHGVVHRDVKPENVFLEPGQPKLGDFGNARVVSVASVTGNSLTWGTPEYVAPEMFMRGRADPRSDLYALGVVLYEMLTARVPWSRDQTITRIAGSSAPFAPTGAGEAFDAALMKLLAVAPGDRPASGEEAIMRLSRPESVVTADRPTCTNCGAVRSADVPRCLACGREVMRLAHNWEGRWALVLEKLEDDATATEKLLRRVGPLSKPLSSARLQFLTGRVELYSKEERDSGTHLPAVLFEHLDADTARSLERSFRRDGLEVRAFQGRSPIRWLRANLTRLGRTELAGLGVSALAPLLALEMTSTRLGGTLALGVLGGVGILLVAFVGANLLRKPKSGERGKPVFELRPQIASMPAADDLLATMADAAAQVRAPEVRALLGDIAVELYRLARRAARLGAAAPGASSEAELLRRTTAAAPALIEGLRRTAARLDDLDAVLDGRTEGELMQTMGRLERAAAAPDADRGALLATRRDLEAALERRHAAEQERARLSAKLCQLLGRLRVVYQRAAAIESPAEQEAWALEAATAELDALLASPPDRAASG